MSNNPKVKLPDTPWHVGFTRKKENDSHRYKARCIHYNGNVFNCGKSGRYMWQCAGSSRCRV